MPCCARCSCSSNAFQDGGFPPPGVLRNTNSSSTWNRRSNLGFSVPKTVEVVINFSEQSVGVPLSVKTIVTGFDTPDHQEVPAQGQRNDIGEIPDDLNSEEVQELPDFNEDEQNYDKILEDSFTKGTRDLEQLRKQFHREEASANVSEENNLDGNTDCRSRNSSPVASGREDSCGDQDGSAEVVEPQSIEHEATVGEKVEHSEEIRKRGEPRIAQASSSEQNSSECGFQLDNCQGHPKVLAALSHEVDNFQGIGGNMSYILSEHLHMTMSGENTMQSFVPVGGDSSWDHSGQRMYGEQDARV